MDLKANAVMVLCLLCAIGNGQVDGLPFNKYSWLVTHNSFSIVDFPPLAGVQRITVYNQEDTVTNQLRVCGSCFCMISIYNEDRKGVFLRLFCHGL